MNWEIERTTQCLRDLKNFAKKHPEAYMATIENLDKYHTALCESSHPRLVQFGFLHYEPKGVIAIDQTGGTLSDGKKRQKLLETRLYTYALLESTTLYLLTIGTKATQPKDIRFTSSAAESIRARFPGGS